jgi:hypothetical protein
MHRCTGAGMELEELLRCAEEVQVWRMEVQRWCRGAEVLRC